MRRHVVVLNHFAAPRGAPGGTRHVELFSRLDGWDARVIAANRNLLTGERPTRADETAFATVWTSPYKGNGVARILNWLSYFVTATIAGLRGPRPDVVYGSSPHLLAGLAAWVIAKLRRGAFVLEVRDLWPRILVEMGGFSESSPVYRVLRALELFLYRRADLVVVMAEGSARALEADGVPASRIEFVPNGADPDDFDWHGDRDAARAAYGFSGTTFVYAGAHGPANGLGLVLDAARRVAEERPDVLFALVGNGPEKPGLQARARAEGITNVRFLDPVPKTEMPRLLAAADVGLHVLADVPLFRYGISPNKLFDYMAAGRPVLTNVEGEVAELVRTADAGLAVAPGDIAEGAIALATLPQERLAEFAANGREFMWRERSRTALAARLQKRLDVVAAARRG